MSTLSVNNVQDLGADAVVTNGVIVPGALPAGSILQMARATDSTTRSTASSTFVDANISVTITPQKNNSQIILIWTFLGVSDPSTYASYQITDSSNIALIGAQRAIVGDADSANYGHVTLIGYIEPGVTSALTYKGRFRTNTSTAYVDNATNTGQLFAIEVAA